MCVSVHAFVCVCVRASVYVCVYLRKFSSKFTLIAEKQPVLRANPQGFLIPRDIIEQTQFNI